MAIYTTFFLAHPEELRSGFPGWKPPLPAPVRREFRHPFTKELVTIETREPEWPEEEQGSATPQYRAVAIQGRYEDYLEGRLPDFVKEKYHWAAKGLTEIELEPLLRAVGVSAELQVPIYGPPSSGAVLRELPQEFISKLPASDRLGVAQRWAAEMSTPEHTHSVTGNKLSDGWTTEEASQILEPLLALARQASSNQRMYLLIEA
jgi:hypothetical protein